MPYRTHTLTLLCLLLITLSFGATSGTLSDGSQISLDPTTGKMMRQTERGSGVLWDGTHRLNDGSVVIIRDGIAITRPTTPSAQPDETNKKEKRERTETTPQAVSPCMTLMIKVCGFNGACNESPACSPARQLRVLEEMEAWKGNISGRDETTSQCKEALRDESFFTPCRQQLISDKPTPCQRLVTQTCGRDGECNNGVGCNPAKQLLKMEGEELLFLQDKNRPSTTSKRCEEAMTHHDFFVPCPDDEDEEEEEDCE